MKHNGIRKKGYGWRPPTSAILTALILFCGPVCATTIYVDASNTIGPWDGLTPATAWSNVWEGAQHLAVTNAVLQGGHVILVSAGTYNGQVNLTNSHSGLPGNPNWLRGEGDVTLVGNANCFNINNSQDNIRIDGFNLTGAGSYAIYGSVSCTGITITNCNIYGNGAGVFSHAGGSGWIVQNCNIMNNTGDGFYCEGDNTRRICSCVIANNTGRGVAERPAPGRWNASYCLFLANGRGHFYDAQTDICYTNATGINSIEGNSNNIVANPDFSVLTGNLRYKGFYSCSPCIDSGENSSDIGRYQNAFVTQASSNIYYVNATTGDDGRTPAQAQSPDTPWLTISRAADIAFAGDTVIVAGGTYSEEVTVTNTGASDYPLTFRASGDVVIDGTTCGIHLLRVTGITVDGIKTCNASNDGTRLEECFDCTLLGVSSFANTRHGVYSDHGNVNSLIACSVFSNASDGVLFFHSGGNTMTRCDVYLNGRHGIAIDFSSYDVFESCDIHHNTQDNIHSYNTGAYDIRFLNCNIYSAVSYGIRLQHLVTASFENCDIFANDMAGTYMENVTLSFVNCIVTSNGTYGCQERDGGGECYTGYSLYHGNSSGNFYDGDTGATLNTAPEINALAGCSNNIVGDPAFRNPGTFDLRLTPGSPCVNAGTPTTTLTIDKYGQQRLTGPAVDIGSYELPPGGTVMVFW